MVNFSNNFLGRGLSFPLAISNGGNFSYSHFEKNINDSIFIILSTYPGERVMRPDFGCRISELLFHPINPTTCNLLCHHIEEALIRWEPRIILKKIEAKENTEHEARIDILIEYINRIVNTAFNFVYPFYLERGEHDTQSQFR